MVWSFGTWVSLGLWAFEGLGFGDFAAYRR